MVVVIDVSVRMFRQLFIDEIDRSFESAFLFLAVMSPDRGKLQLTLSQLHKPEQILEAPRIKRVSFHVEEQISFVRVRQAVESLCRFPREQFEAILAGVALPNL